MPTVEVAGVAVEVECGREAGILRGRACFPDGLDNVRVVASHGYDPIPGDIEDAVLEMAEMTFYVEAGVTSRTAGAESVAFAPTIQAGVTQRWAETVEKYKLWGEP